MRLSFCIAICSAVLLINALSARAPLGPGEPQPDGSGERGQDSFVAPVPVAESTKRQLPSLHLAVFQNSITDVTSLLLSGAKVNVRDARLGLTPLHLARSPEVAALLIDHGADLEARDHAGRTPLHYAASSGSSSLVRLMIKRGANPLAASASGETPLVAAAGIGSIESVRLLLGDNTSPNALLTACVSALVSQHDDVVQFLLHHSAQSLDLLLWSETVDRSPSRLRLATDRPLYRVVGVVGGETYLVCLQLALLQGFGSRYDVYVYDRAFRMTRRGNIITSQDDQPYCLVALCPPAETAESKRESRCPLAIGIWPIKAAYLQDAPLEVGPLDYSRVKSNYIYTRIVQWADEPMAPEPTNDVTVKWSELGTSLLKATVP